MISNPVVHLIDDDDAARDALMFLLSAANFAVRTYESAKAFLNIIPAIEAGCVITDVRMPEINGLDLLRRSRDMRCQPSPPRTQVPWTTGMDMVTRLGKSRSGELDGNQRLQTAIGR
jgi:DNA-binding NtrC family response regulator